MGHDLLPGQPARRVCLEFIPAPAQFGFQRLARLRLPTVIDDAVPQPEQQFQPLLNRQQSETLFGSSEVHGISLPFLPNYRDPRRAAILTAPSTAPATPPRPAAAGRAARP